MLKKNNVNGYYMIAMLMHYGFKIWIQSWMTQSY